MVAIWRPSSLFRVQWLRSTVRWLVSQFIQTLINSRSLTGFSFAAIALLHNLFTKAAQHRNND